MTSKTRQRLTVTGVWTAIVMVAGGLAMSVDWALKKSQSFGVESATVDSLRATDSLLILEVRDIKRTLRMQSRKLQTVSKPQKEGWLRRTMRKLI